MTDTKLECFVISPIGSPGTTIRNEADWVLKKLIRPALAESYAITRADEFTKGEIITNKVITSIQNADLLVAVMSGHNPNVFYELAVAHAYSKPVVPLIKDSEPIPFDVGLVGTIFYSHDDVAIWDAAIEQLKVAADATRVSGYAVTNPITMALGAAKASAAPDTSEQMVANLTSELAAMRSDIADLQTIVTPAPYGNALANYGEWQRKITGRELQAALFKAHDDSISRKRNDMARLIEGVIARREEKLRRPLTKEERAAVAASYYEPDIGVPDPSD